MSAIDTPSSLSDLDFEFEKSDFDLISDIAYRNFGICLPESKKLMVYSRISRRMRALQLKKFSDYKELITGKDPCQERMELLSALTTNVTHFFREQHHFDFLTESVLPRLIKKAKDGEKVRLWSAGCSTGQEPYSMAMAVLHACPDAANFDIKILATDVDPKVIHQAQLGEFQKKEIEKVAPEIKNQYFDISKRNSEMVVVDKAVSDLISFATLNLIDPLPISGPIDAVFCRNVTIYFDTKTQQKVWSQISQVLATNGYLFVGHSERLSGPSSSNFKPTNVTTYQKIKP